MNTPVPAASGKSSQPPRDDHLREGVATPIDLALLLDRCMDDGALALLVLSKFEEQAAANLRQLVEHVESGNLADAAKRAHALKGTAGAIAAEALMAVAADLDELSQKGETARAEDCLGVVRSEVDRCLAYLPEVRRVLGDKGDGNEPRP